MKKYFVAGFILLIILGGVMPLTAQNTTLPENEEDIPILDEETTVPARAENLSSFGAWDIIRMILIFACVVAAIYVVVFLLKKAGGPRLQNNDLIRLRASQALTSNTSLHLVEIGREIFLVGSAENSVNLISVISEKETADELRLKFNAAEPGKKKNFQEVLAGLFRGNPPGRPDDYRRPEDFLGSQKDRLKKL